MSAPFPGYKEVCAEVRNQSQLEIAQSYQDPLAVAQLRTYHVGQHPDFVEPFANRLSQIVFDEAVPHPAIGLIVPPHDVIPPERAIERDPTRPNLFQDKYTQIFNGKAERQSWGWFVERFGERLPKPFLGVAEGVLIGTTCTLEGDVIRQPFIACAVDPRAAFVVAKADVLHQVALNPSHQIDACLQLFLEQYPDFVAAMCSANFSLGADQYEFLVEEIRKLPPKGVSFYDSQKEQISEDGGLVFTGQSVVKAIVTRFEAGFERLRKAYDVHTWEWLKDPQSLTKRLQQAIPFYAPPVDK